VLTVGNAHSHCLNQSSSWGFHSIYCVKKFKDWEILLENMKNVTGYGGIDEELQGIEELVWVGMILLRFACLRTREIRMWGNRCRRREVRLEFFGGTPSEKLLVLHVSGGLLGTLEIDDWSWVILCMTVGLSCQNFWKRTHLGYGNWEIKKERVQSDLISPHPVKFNW
jgi:hypothetical protein